MSDVIVKMFVDVLAALHHNSLPGHVHGFDSARPSGSAGQGTYAPRTRVREGDRVFWIPLSLECEAHIAIVSVDVGTGAQQPEPFPWRGATCWGLTATGLPPVLPYSLVFELGHLGRRLTLGSGPALVCPPAHTADGLEQR